MVTSWNAFYGPKGMPPQAVETLETVVTKILQQPDTIAKFKSIGFDATAVPSEQLGKRMDYEIGRWNKVIEAAGLEKQ